jgi:hypothetical protein
LLVYIQWAKSQPEDYDAYEISSMQDVRRLPRKGIPSSGSNLDNNDGWVADLVVQGVSFAGYDHLSAAFPAAGVLRVFAWNDDPVDYPEGPSAYVWDFHPPTADPRYGGQTNTRQFLTVYTNVTSEIAAWTGQSTTGGAVTILPYASFPTPAANASLHGIWVEDTLYAQHKALRTLHGWREWIGG